jgi:hypothetical protein
MSQTLEIPDTLYTALKEAAEARTGSGYILITFKRAKP